MEKRIETKAKVNCKSKETGTSLEKERLFKCSYVKHRYLLEIDVIYKFIIDGIKMEEFYSKSEYSMPRNLDIIINVY